MSKPEKVCYFVHMLLGTFKATHLLHHSFVLWEGLPNVTLSVAKVWNRLTCLAFHKVVQKHLPEIVHNQRCRKSIQYVRAKACQNRPSFDI